MTTKKLLSSSSGRHRRAHRPYPVRLPRALLLWWSMWLLASWVLAFGTSSPFFSNIRSYELGVQRLSVLLSLGIAIGWPLIRLSGRSRTAPRLVAFVDWLALAGTLQVVLFPMRVSAQWSFTRLLALDGTLVLWALIFGAIIALGTADHTRLVGSEFSPKDFKRHENRARSQWMVVCLLLVVLGPFLSIIIESPLSIASDHDSELFFWSPAGAAWMMGRHAMQDPTRMEWIRLGCLGAAAFFMWMGVLLPLWKKSPSSVPTK